MKKSIIYFTLLLFVTSTLVFAETNSFDKESAPWHKKAIMTCGMLRNMKTFDQQKMLKNLDELSIELNALQKKYADNPPLEYSNDPLWKIYLEDFADNIAIVKERVEKKQYRLAQNYCGNFCRIFGRMHKNNGLTDLTDLMFNLRAEIKGAMDMYNAQNANGTKQSIASVKILLNKVNVKVDDKNDAVFNELFKPFKDAASSWIDAVEKDNKNEVMNSFKSFMDAFPKPYIASISNN